MTGRSGRPGRDVAVVTGGASGIGLALARTLLDRGRTVVVADRDGERLARAADDLRAAGGEVHDRLVDVTDQRSLDELVEHARRLGPLGAVCLNAGVTSAGPTTWATSVESFDAVVAVNLRGLFASIRSFVPVLVAQGRPAAILVTASMAGLVATPSSAVYAASKAGAIALAKALQGELATEAPEVTVTILAPGMVRTELIRTSAATLTGGAAIDPSLAAIAHQVLEEGGVAPEEAARWAMEAIDDGLLWAVPQAEDAFTEQLRTELDVMRAALPAPPSPGGRTPGG